MITTYISTEVIAEHCQRRMTTFDSQPHVSMLEHPLFALWLPEALVIWLKTLVSTNLGLCCQAEEIPSLNFPSTLSSRIYPGEWPFFFNLQFHWDVSYPLMERRSPFLFCSTAEFVILHRSETWKYFFRAMSCGHCPETEEVTSLWQLVVQGTPAILQARGIGAFPCSPAALQSSL